MQDPATLADRFLDIIETDIVPKTRAGTAAGNKVFGAAILKKANLSLIVADTNQETANPLFHGEIATLNTFYRLPTVARPDAADCLFCSTHEPCPLCLSAVTWAGFEQQRLSNRMAALAKTYAELSATYQANKGPAGIPLA